MTISLSELLKESTAAAHAQRIFAFNGAISADLYAAVGGQQQGVA